MSQLTVGFLGCGLIARSHAAAVATDRRVAITAVYDPDRRRATEFANQVGSPQPIEVCTESDAVIAAVDIVYVCTWTSAHPQLVLAAAQAGRAVFCEKPLATNLADAAAMTEAVQTAGITNQVGLVLRYSPAFRYLHHLVNQPEVGQVMNVVFRDDQYLPTQGLYGSTWRGDVDRAGGGTLLEHSIHDLDLLDWLCGPIVEVSARTGEVNGLPGIDDHATVVLIGADGAQAALTSVWHDVLSRPSQRLVEVFTRGGYFALEGDWNGPVHWDRSRSFDGRDRAEAVGSLAGPDLAAAASNVDRLEPTPDHAFISAVIEGGQAYPDFATALRAHQLTDAAYRSAAEGGTVQRVAEGPAGL